MSESNWQWVDEALAAERAPRWEAYLASAYAGLDGEDGYVKAATLTRQLWAWLHGHIFAPTLTGGEPEGGEVSLTMYWNHGPHHLEIESYASGLWDWFYMDRRDDDSTRAGHDLPTGGGIPAELLDLLPRFKQEKPQGETRG